MDSSQKRIEWIDFARTFAIVCVLLVHATEGIYQFNLEYMFTVSVQSKLFAFSAFTLGRFGVPIFLMISGYLLLDREYDVEKCRYFWKNNWFRLLICTEVWIVAYSIFLSIRSKEDINIKYLIEEMLFIRRTNMSHMWYMPMVLGLYIWIPLLAIGLKSVNIKMLKFPFVVFCMYSFGYPFVKILAGVLKCEDTIELQFSLGFSGGVYGIYLVLGYLIKKGVFKDIKTSVLFWIVMISFACTVIFQLYAYTNEYCYNVWYDCPFILVCTWGLFEILSRMKNIKLYNVVKYISYYSFAIYLLHNIFRMIFIPYVKALQCGLPVKVTILLIISLFLSMVIAYSMNKIPKIAKYVLFIK